MEAINPSRCSTDPKSQHQNWIHSDDPIHHCYEIAY